MESETWWTESKTKETESETNGTEQERNQRNETEKITGKETSWTENKTKRAGKEPQRLWENYWLGKGIFFCKPEDNLKRCKVAQQSFNKSSGSRKTTLSTFINLLKHSYKIVVLC